MSAAKPEAKNASVMPGGAGRDSVVDEVSDRASQMRQPSLSGAAFGDVPEGAVHGNASALFGRVKTIAIAGKYVVATSSAPLHFTNSWASSSGTCSISNAPIEEMSDKAEASR